ncbi:MAG: hypothetical protein DI536_26995 [Archangium gephyra]|uniref:Uncharacterized protein n=1 Tax=Archangium gephyra TaxID=48 RepID=A0A2W5T3T6_9BACT|nr:MAG: hypothetical protein DI536_26995 [Archangium gephyra]
MDSGRSHLQLVPHDDDGALVAAVRGGDRRSADALVRRAGPRAKAAIRRLLRRATPDDADLLQLVLIELVTSIDSFRGDCSLNTWVDRIAAHVVYKRLRRRSLEARLFEGLGEEGHDVAGAQSAERASVTSNLVARVRSRLAELDQDKVTAWLMFDVHGLSLEELAHALEITPVAAQSRVSRARKEVRACLERDPELAQAMSQWEVPS